MIGGADAQYVESRRQYALKLRTKSEEAYARVKQATERASALAHELSAAQKAGSSPRALTNEEIEAIALPLVVVMKEQHEILTASWQVAMELALGLDEAIAGLDYYADPKTWVEVPPNTPAAQDLGQRAKTTLYRINPS